MNYEVVDNQFTEDICQCRLCGEVFEKSEATEISKEGVRRHVCPKCKHYFSIIKLANINDEKYLKQFETAFSC